MGRFWSNFDVKISTSNFLSAGEIPIFLSCFRKKCQLRKDNYSNWFSTTTYDFWMKTSKFNKKWISQQNFSIPTGMYSGKGIVWHHMGPHAEAFFPSYDHYILACDWKNSSMCESLSRCPKKIESKRKVLTRKLKTIKLCNELGSQVSVSV